MTWSGGGPTARTPPPGRTPDSTERRRSGCRDPQAVPRIPRSAVPRLPSTFPTRHCETGPAADAGCAPPGGGDMPRPPLPVGTFGKIDFFVLQNQRVRARASFRDFDGRRRFVTRYGSSRAQAERRLREALRDRTGPGDDGSDADSRMSYVVALWLADVDDSDLAAGTKRVYHFAVQNYVLPGL